MIPSDQEREIRAATVSRIRQLMPAARVIHELNVEKGIVRADIAAVCPDHLYLFEIKSQNDTLHRLGNQIRHFHPVCHGLIVVAHEKWCGAATAAGYPNCDAGKIIALHGRATLWQWPEPERVYGRDWTLPSPTPPWHHRMLRLLWAEELRGVAHSHGIPVTAKTPAYKLSRILASSLTGAEIEKAVCAALRSRSFAWADPIMEQAA